MRSLMPILLIVVSVGLFYVFIDPRLQVARELSDEASEYKEAIQKANDLMVVRDELLTQYNSISSNDIERLKRIVPDSVDLVKMVADIDTIAGDLGIAIQSVETTEEVVDDSLGINDPASLRPYLTADVSLKFITDYPNLILFLKELERSLQMIDIKSVTFSAGTSQNNLYDFSVSFQTYWLR